MKAAAVSKVEGGCSKLSTTNQEVLIIKQTATDKDEVQTGLVLGEQLWVRGESLSTAAAKLAAQVAQSSELVKSGRQSGEAMDVGTFGQSGLSVQEGEKIGAIEPTQEGFNIVQPAVQYSQAAPTIGPSVQTTYTRTGGVDNSGLPTTGVKQSSGQSTASVLATNVLSEVEEGEISDSGTGTDKITPAQKDNKPAVAKARPRPAAKGQTESAGNKGTLWEKELKELYSSI